MQIATLEHVNVTVSDPSRTAAWLSRVFDWYIRWEGPSMNDGHTVHVGGDDSYLALYSTEAPKSSVPHPPKQQARLNHIAFVVEDLNAVEKRVRAEGFKTHNHDDYAPGRRFYFHDLDDVEYEVVSYISQKDAFKRQVTRQLGAMARFGALTH